MDFSSAGLKDGIIKGAKVAVWVGASGAVTALIAELSKVSVTNNDVRVGLFITLTNAVLVGLKHWLETKE